MALYEKITYLREKKNMSQSELERQAGLISLNSKYEPMMFSNEEIETKPVKIIGKVIELRRKL